MRFPVPTNSALYAGICAGGLVVGSCVLTSIGGEAGGDHTLPWLAVLSLLTLIWLASLRVKSVSLPLLLGVALAMRLAFLLMQPGYDMFRYVWEGRILLGGFNPYLHPPEDPLLASFRDNTWKTIGHPAATAIYPPLTQWLFAAMASIGLKSLGFKVVFTMVDMILSLLLCRRFGPRAALIYAWNPLAAVSFAGGGHYDCVFMLAMVLVWFSLKPGNRPSVISAILLGAAIALKWMAVPLGIWMVAQEWRNHGFKRSLLTGSLVAMPAVFTWATLSLWTGEWTLQLMPRAFSLSVRSTELIPAITDFIFRTSDIDNRWFLGALVLAWIYVGMKSRTLLEAAEWGFLATYILSPMLHAWYFVWILPFAVKSRNPGIIALAATGITYFLVHYSVSQPGGKWTFSWWERSLIWLPFLIGFLYHYSRRTWGNKKEIA